MDFLGVGLADTLIADFHVVVVGGGVDVGREAIDYCLSAWGLMQERNETYRY